MQKKTLYTVFSTAKTIREAIKKIEVCEKKEYTEYSKKVLVKLLSEELKETSFNLKKIIKPLKKLFLEILPNHKEQEGEKNIFEVLVLVSRDVSHPPEIYGIYGENSDNFGIDWKTVCTNYLLEQIAKEVEDKENLLEESIFFMHNHGFMRGVLNHPDIVPYVNPRKQNTPGYLIETEAFKSYHKAQNLKKISA